MLKFLSKQFRQPSGFLGRIVAKLMETKNLQCYKILIPFINIQENDKVLEIGYGTGQGIEWYVNEVPECAIYGLDFSELMYKKASKRHKKLIESGKLTLRFGDILSALFYEKYHKIFCVNVIYFWTDLHKVFSRIFPLLEENGTFGIYMTHSEYLEKAGLNDVFNKYSIVQVEEALKKAGFKSIEYKFDFGYYIVAKK